LPLPASGWLVVINLELLNELERHLRIGGRGSVILLGVAVLGVEIGDASADAVRFEVICLLFRSCKIIFEYLN